jgi:hypothetical protein
VIWKLEEKECILVVMLLWCWWLERNRIRGGERRREAAGIAFIIRFQAEEFMKIDAHQRRSDAAGIAFIIRFQADKFIKINARESPKPLKALKRWSKPIEDVLKINSDAVFDPVTKKGGWGFVIWDSEGAMILAGAGAAPHALDAPPCRSVGLSGWCVSCR